MSDECKEYWLNRDVLVCGRCARVFTDFNEWLEHIFPTKDQAPKEPRNI